MKPVDSRLRRLLGTAANAEKENASPTMPFGFDTRVVALARTGHPNGGNGIIALVRRVAVLAAIILVVGGAASFREFRAAEDMAEPTSNDYAIADTAIEDELYQ
ncbi:MAG TPA: hypothetical protein VJ719_07045 [Chthoniobacterales bacterium]|nr:hypothetical protein [Chthoniobacterales bacterium]